MQLCVALDLPSEKQNLALVAQFCGFSGLWLKIGLSSFVRGGRGFVESVRAAHPSARLFLDLKLYDIPNTMLETTKAIAEIGIDMFTIHASSGTEAMRAVAEQLGALPKPPLVFAVSVLTSFDERGFAEIYGTGSLCERAQHMAHLASMCGIDGMVCSVHESRAIKAQTGLLTLTPGIRPFATLANDQKRVGSLQDALNAQSDFVVMGRPIYEAQNPQKALTDCYAWLQSQTKGTDND
ncbi:MAG: orotidine-5'-phosphate decarboxylase [Helicobacter sp.]|nr:orotidine-5'-phosphate decarboxylase [Helicobacter sp.]